ncbi:hypothetical protein PQJ75_27775 [Rhodoplanes sp. TEM]|uniref:DUF1640 domain-containing protein n=1 Tax=Rhodoplanes tepidamans TaxID=200616 RepID=A0ABT5JEJ2_RHOTP|nr:MULTISPECIES: hypothetical protein [Rhodoplanes]MDC7788098.1 hypothetical protein [Rhodoplanes tepidamans]MDC7987551.1 hypothetical protein [Rhodoplanes sp. TEM]MDQ0355612.1 hypothetical protein [Rhodoplanes tepidamans]
MVFAFDTLGYSKRLRDGGVPPAQAEAHAEAARDFIMVIMVELVTKSDLAAAVDRIDGTVGGLRAEMDLRFDGLRRDVDARIEKLSLQLTVRLGALMVAGLGALAVILRLQ